MNFAKSVEKTKNKISSLQDQVAEEQGKLTSIARSIQDAILNTKQATATKIAELQTASEAKVSELENILKTI